MARGEALESILENVVVGLGTDVDGLQGVLSSVDLGLINHTATMGQCMFKCAKKEDLP